MHGDVREKMGLVNVDRGAMPGCMRRLTELTVSADKFPLEGWSALLETEEFMRMVSPALFFGLQFYLFAHCRFCHDSCPYHLRSPLHG